MNNIFPIFMKQQQKRQQQLLICFVREEVERKMIYRTAPPIRSPSMVSDFSGRALLLCSPSY